MRRTDLIKADLSELFLYIYFKLERKPFYSIIKIMIVQNQMCYLLIKKNFRVFH